MKMNGNRKKNLHLLFDVLLAAVLVLIDQFTKYAAVIHLKNRPSIVLISNVLELHYLENRGAAFGMLQNKKIFFVFITLIIMAIIAYVIYKIPEKGYRFFEITLVFIFAGAVGNFIDRLRLDYVVDFIYFKLIDFPIFNVADIYVSVFSLILIILLAFVYKEKDFAFLSKTAKKRKDGK